jgi:nodulation protein E
LGVLSAIGADVPAFWASLSEGYCGIETLQGFENLRIKTAARLKAYLPAQHFGTSDVRDLDSFAQYFSIVGRAAVKDSGLLLQSTNTAVLSATSGGGLETLDREYQRLYRDGSPSVHPLAVPRFMANAGASHLCQELALMGPCLTLSTACSSSNHAIGLAYWMVRQGVVAAALTGGSEAPFSYGNLKAWEATRAVDPDPCRPFSLHRNGLSLGEGAAVLVLEQRDLALARGARIYGEIVGFGMSADAHHLMKPLSSGAALAMRAALDDAELSPGEIDYINAHGTGTRLNDATETEAIKDVFGNHAPSIMVSSSKSMHGHALGAAGALEATATLLALHHDVVPPTINHREPDPACDLDVVPNQARQVPLRYAMSNSFAFGGLNAVLVFGKA